MKDELLKLADRVGALTKGDNHMDVLCEVALFKPNCCFSGVRANNAGTKLVYRDAAGNNVTCWAEEWTGADRRTNTIERLRALAQEQGDA